MCKLDLMCLVSHTCLVCGRPSLPDELEVEALQRVYEPGEEAVLSCARGYIRAGGSRILICTKDGEWSKVTLKCARELTMLNHCEYSLDALYMCLVLI